MLAEQGKHSPWVALHNSDSGPGQLGIKQMKTDTILLKKSSHGSFTNPEHHRRDYTKNAFWYSTRKKSTSQCTTDKPKVSKVSSVSHTSQLS